MRWFGESWGAPVNDGGHHIKTPVGRECGRCEIPIAEGDQGVDLPFVGSVVQTTIPYHRACFLKEVVPESIIEEFNLLD